MAWVGNALRTVGTWLSNAWNSKSVWGTVFRAAVKYGASKLAEKALGGRRKSVTGPGFTMSQDPSPIDVVIYGQQRVSGPIAFYWSHDKNNKFANMIIVLASHEVEEISSIMWVNEERVVLDGVDATGRFADRLWVSRNLGTADQAADARLLTRVAAPSWSGGPAWTSAYRLRGRAYVHIEMQSDEELYASGIPNFSFLVKGKRVYDPRTEATGWSDNPALILRDYLTDTDWGMGALAEQVDEAAVIAAANICDEEVDSDLAVEVECTTIAAESYVDVVDTTGIYVGQAVSGTGIAAGTRVVGVFPTEGNVYVDPAPTASGTVTLAFAATARRYRCDAAIRTDTEPGAIIDAIEASMGGKCAPVGGAWTMRAGAWYEPTGDALTADDLRGSPQVQCSDGLAEAVNRVHGTYTSPKDLFQTVPFPIVKNDTYTTADGGIEHLLEVDLPFVTSPNQAQRLAKIELERSRQGIVLRFPAKFTALRISPVDTVLVTLAAFGFDEKPFEVLSLDISDSDDGIDLVLRETASGVYDWAGGDETQIDLAPNTVLPNPFTVAAPVDFIVESGTAHLLRAGDGTIISRAWLYWEGSDGLTNAVASIEYKLFGDADWMAAGRTDPGAPGFYIGPLADGVAWDFRVRFTNAIGVHSPWAEVIEHIVVGKTAPPTAPDAPTAVGPDEDNPMPPRIAYPNIRMYACQVLWSDITDLDALGYEISTTSTPLAEPTGDGTFVRQGVGNHYHYTFQLLPNFVWIRSVDTSGNKSDWVLGPNLTDYVAYPGGDLAAKNASDYASGPALATIAALEDRALPEAGSVVVISGAAAAGDGKGGLFRYDAASEATADGRDVIEPTTGTGRYLRNSDALSGTWSPALKFGAATTGITYDTQLGTWRREGRLVFVEGHIELTSKGTATGAATIAGLPFTASIARAIRCPVAAWSGLPAEPCLRVAEDVVALFATAAAAATALDDDDFGDTTELIFSVTYQIE